MKLEPMNGRLAVKRMEPDQQTPGGIWLPDGAKGKNEVVRVLATCPAWITESGRQVSTQYEPGDLLLVSKYTGEEFELDGGRLKVVLLKEQDVLARLNVEDSDTRLPTATKVQAAVELGGDGVETQQYEAIPA